MEWSFSYFWSGTSWAVGTARRSWPQLVSWFTHCTRSRLEYLHQGHLVQVTASSQSAHINGWLGMNMIFISPRPTIRSRLTTSMCTYSIHIPTRRHLHTNSPIILHCLKISFMRCSGKSWEISFLKFSALYLDRCYHITPKAYQICLEGTPEFFLAVL